MDTTISYLAHGVVGASSLLQSLGEQDWYGDSKLEYTYEGPASPPSGVPEPAGWTLMLPGFSAVGQALRGRRAAIAAR